MDGTKENETKLSETNTAADNLAKSKSKTRAKKRKRAASGSTDEDEALPENTFEMEKTLHATAIKNNLDDLSVKKILKKVVTNDHVLAFVKLREEEEDSDIEERLGPKLTRAKAKELMKASPNSVPTSSAELGTKPWNLELVPIKHIPVKTRPEVKALIAQELPDDEDDEEYKPTHDDVPSDEDHVSCSDLESQPGTPATPRSVKKPNPKLVEDGPFKVPQECGTQVRRKLDLEEEATIALRTRSKLSLSATPIEHIESSFIPPDDLPPDVDDLWNEFLNECLNPAFNVKHEEDDETDPEYNVAADPDAKEEDEDLQLMKISKKELSDLVNELFQVMPDGADDQLMQGVLEQDKNQLNINHWEGKQEPKSDDDTATTPKCNATSQMHYENRIFTGKTEPQDYENDNENDQNNMNNQNVEEVASSVNLVPDTSTDALKPQKVTMSVEEKESHMRSPKSTSPVPPAPLLGLLTVPKPQTVQIEVDDKVKFYPEQVLILQQQLRQHVQLATSTFLQLFIHPTLWMHAPKYKEYLVQLNEKTLEFPNSVVNVCNLKPAVALVESWQKSLSESTPDAMAMVEFLQKQVEKCRRRTAQNSTYNGEFHELYQRVVANSSVFLYPFLLPPMPFKADLSQKRFSYQKSEDELIVLGLDQFWKYMEMNPEIFRRPRVHPCKRWGLAGAAQLVCKHMMPWVKTRALLSHIQTARKSSPDTPIARYFKKNEIVPVKHKLLPFNPKLTLYEQSETEMPRIWVKYLSKSSKRFRDYYYKRKVEHIEPTGVEVSVGCTEAGEKQPLPIDFTKEIACNRINILPKTPKQPFVDKVDVHIQKPEEITATTLPATNYFKLVNTSSGLLIVPLQIETKTVNSTTTPICTPTVINSNNVANKIADTNKIGDTKIDESITNSHCQCCNLLRKIVRKRQTHITDFFGAKKDKKCECTDKKYPRMSNKLRILVNNYKTHVNNVRWELLKKIRECKNNLELEDDGISYNENFNSKDFVSAIKFQVKLVHRCSIARNNNMKRLLNTAFVKFDTSHGDVVSLTKHICKILDVELVDMYKEFLGFLTAEQADTLDVFKDYFVRNCVEDLVEKVQELISHSDKRHTMLEAIDRTFQDNISQSCEMCCRLLSNSREYPELAQYIFSLFPHRRRKVTETPENANITLADEQTVIVNGNVEEQNMEKDDVNRDAMVKYIDEKFIKNENTDTEDSEDNEDMGNDNSMKDIDSENIKEEDIEEDKIVEEFSGTKDSQEKSNMEDSRNEAMDTEIEHSDREDIQMEEIKIVIENECLKEENVDIQDSEEHNYEDDMEDENTMVICEENITKNYEADDSSSEDEERDKTIQERIDSNPLNDNTPIITLQANKVDQPQAITIVKKVPNQNTIEISFTDLQIPRNRSKSPESPIIVVSQENTIKTEIPEWRRDEDKLILEILKNCFTPEQIKNKTIMDVIDDEAVLGLIAENLSHKSVQEIRDRILWLLKILVSSGNK